MRRLANPFIAVLAAVALLGASCGSDSTDAAGRSMELTVLEGQVSFVHDGSSKKVTGSLPVAVGDSIVMSNGSRAELRLAQGRKLELDSARVSVVSSDAVKITAGAILAEVTKALRIDAEDVTISARRGSVRIDREIAIRVANYGQGNVKVIGPADELLVPKLRQAVIAGGIVPRAPKPMQLSAADRWDQRFLQAAIDLDVRLSNFARGLEAQLGSGEGLEFFATIAPPGDDLGFLGPYLSNRRSDLLIGLIVSSLSARSSGLALPQRFAGIFDLWRDGASWGLIAHEFGVKQEGLFGSLLEAVQKAGFVTPAGAGPGITRANRARPRRPRPSASPSPGRPSPSSSPTSPQPPRCDTEPRPPDCTVPTPVPTTGTIIDDLFKPQNVIEL